MMYFTKQELADLWEALSIALEEDPFDAPEAKRMEKLARKFHRSLRLDIWHAPKLEWEKNGPNLYAELTPGVELFIGQNDRTGKYTVTVRGMNTKVKTAVVAYPTLKAAKASAQRVADLIMKEVQ